MNSPEIALSILSPIPTLFQELAKRIIHKIRFNTDIHNLVPRYPLTLSKPMLSLKNVRLLVHAVPCKDYT